MAYNIASLIFPSLALNAASKNKWSNDFHDAQIVLNVLSKKWTLSVKRSSQAAQFIHFAKIINKSEGIILSNTSTSILHLTFQITWGSVKTLFHFYYTYQNECVVLYRFLFVTYSVGLSLPKTYIWHLLSFFDGYFYLFYRANPVQAGSQEEFSQWLCHAHNVVNRR